MSATLTLSDLGMVGPEAFTWPVSYRFDMSTPFGQTQLELCVDVPGLYDKRKATRLLGPWLWTMVIAPAITRGVVLDTIWSIVWGHAFIPELDAAPIEMRGQHFGSGTPRDDSAQWVLVTGEDPRWNRRVFLPSVPRSWASGGLLTTSGWENLLEYARAAFMGLQWLAPDPVAQWMVAYPGVVPVSLTNINGVGFRPVKEVRVCWHTDKAPTPPGGPWP